MSGNIFTKISRKTKHAMYGEGMVDAPVEKLLKLSSEEYKTLPLATLNRIPVYKRSELPPEALDKFSDDQLRALPTPTLAKLLSKTLNRLPSDILVKLPPKTLMRLDLKNIQQLPPHTLANVLPELPIEAFSTFTPDQIQLALMDMSEQTALVMPDEYLAVFPQIIGAKGILKSSRFFQKRYSPHYLQLLRDSLPSQSREATPEPHQVWGIANKSSDRTPSIPVVERTPSIPVDRTPSLPFQLPAIAPFEFNEFGTSSGFSPPAKSMPASPRPPRNPGPPPAALDNERLQRKPLPEYTSSPPSPTSSPPNERPVLLNRSLSKLGGERRESIDVKGRHKALPIDPPKGDSGADDGSNDRLVEVNYERKGDIKDKDLIDQLDKELKAARSENRNLEGDIKGKDLIIDRLDKELIATRKENSKHEADKVLAENEKRREHQRMYQCLRDLEPGATYDPRADPVDRLIDLCKEFFKSAEESEIVAKNALSDLQDERVKGDRVESDLSNAMENLRVARDELAQFQHQDAFYRDEIRDWSDKLAAAEREKVVLSNDLQRSKREYKDLALLLDQERRTSDARLRDQQEQHNLQIQDLHQQHEAQSMDLRKQVQQLEQQLNAQKDDLAWKMQNQRISYEKEAKRLQDKLTAQEQKHQEDILKKQAEHEAILQKERDHFSAQIEGQRLEYERDREKIQIAIDKELRRREDLHERNVVDLKAKVKNLEGDLVDNSDDFRPATDDTLKVKYKDLKLTIETIASPFNIRAINIPRGVDADGFLSREGKGKFFVLLRSIVWEKIVEGFFSSPFGFGALGPGDGRKMLFELYSAWRRLFTAGSSNASGSYAQEQSFDLFRTDKEANKWRAATFQSIMMAVVPKGQKKGAAASGEMVRPYTSNRKRVHDEISAILNAVCSNGATEELDKKVNDIIRLASELALEFGSQRAQLGLEMPGRGTDIQLGPDFEDYEDGGGTKGSLETVDLTVSPRLFRVGDGRSDLKTRKTIVPGEIYPRQS
ncbi:hypothetical protein B0H63DRAFT_468077 [Podospora didyma]|uniref:Uncharacterized protein n=1 Tax=Podospora didyma TaxID=330526 RepID=A0AAE0NRZ5_9PEZI|nr:hypothetical protein B0H63DRAFT_468077 [Podospora didyma]